MKKTAAFQPALHCKIDEKAFSKAMFLCRFFTGSALIYMAVGSLLYWREFLFNAAFWGFPYTVGVAFGLLGLQLFLGLFLLLGWYTRVCALFAFLMALTGALIFFAGNLNHVFVAWCLLLAAPLGVLMGLGPGIFSLDFRRSQRAARQIFRGKL